MLPCSKKWKVTQTKCVDFDVAEKRKAETPVVADGNDPNEAPSHSNGKKRRIEWTVGTTTEESNNDELVFPHSISFSSCRENLALCVCVFLGKNTFLVPIFWPCFQFGH